jgi:hypothetical protein
MMRPCIVLRWKRLPGVLDLMLLRTLSVSIEALEVTHF